MKDVTCLNTMTHEGLGDGIYTHIYMHGHTHVHTHEHTHAQQMYESVMVRPDGKGWLLAQW